MAIIAKLVKGTRELNLNSGRYSLAADFRPPTGEDGRRGWRFGIHVKAVNKNNAAEIHQALSDIQAMLAETNDTAEPLQLWYKADDTIPFEPIFGTIGRFSRYTITRGELAVGRNYGVANVRTQVVPDCQINLTIEPDAEAGRQRIGKAYGGIYQDWIGGERQQSKGVLVNPASGTGGNLFTNPVFGNATWDTGWSVGAGLDEARKEANYDPEYLLIGPASAKVFAVADGGTLYQSATLTGATSYTVSVYAKLPGGGDITAQDYCGIHYDGTDSAATWVSVGNGWYRGYKTITGTGGAANLGVYTTIGVTVYYDAFQVEIGADMTPFFYGDLPGCAWSGTRHASSSTRTAGVLTVPGADFNFGVCTGVIAWRIPHGTTQSGTDYLLDTDQGASGFRLYYASGNITFQANAQTASSALTHTDGTIVIAHFASFGLTARIYVNGTFVTNASGAITVNSAMSTLYLGSDNAAGNHAEGNILYFGWYNQFMTNAQVTANYNEIYSAIYNSDPGLLSSPGIPYVWTDDSDFTIDQAQDGTYDGYAILSGMPGDLPPKTEYELEGVRTGTTTRHNVFIGVTPLEYPDIAKITDLKLYDDKSGVVDATASGGEYESITVNSTSTWAGPTAYTAFDKPWSIKGPIHAMVRLKGGTGNILVRTRMLFGQSSTPANSTQPISLTTTTDYRWYYIGTLTAQQLRFLERQNQRASATVQFLKISTNETIYLDLISYIVGPLQYQPNEASTTATSKAIFLSEQNCSIGAVNTTTPIDIYTMRGAYPWPEPNCYNVLNIWYAIDGGTNSLNNTITFDNLYITPRWQIV